MNSLRYRIYATVFVLVYSCAVFAQQGNNWVDGELHTFISNGAWCWFQDERAVIDTAKNKLIVASTNSGNSNDVAIVNLDTKQVESSKRTRNMIKWADDHNSPGLLVLPNGNYIAMWAQHYDTEYRYFIYSNGSWSGEKSVPWSQYGDVSDCNVAYANLYYLSDEDRVYACGRVFDRAPNFVYSDDNGESWKYGGQLTTNSSNSYNKGYYKYWGNGKDRIDMVFTEEHPRDQRTSIYHGYIQDHKMSNSYDEVGDEDIYSKNVIPTFEKFTKVFAHGTQVNGVTMGRCWQSDICRYDDGTIAILFKARANDSETDHRNFYARFDGEEWKVTYIGKAGPKMYDDEQDYTGLAALNPDDPTRIYVSSPFNPGDDNSRAGKREIWRGITDDHGETWEWEPVTANSSEDNFRPIIPKWKPGKEAVLWFRGTYETAQIFRTNIVGTFYDYEPTVSAKNKNSVDKNLTSKVGFSAHPTAGTHQMTLRYTVAAPAQVSLRIFSLAGQQVATLKNQHVSAGDYSFDWNTSHLPAGMYLAQLTINRHSHVHRVRVQH